MIIKKAAMFGLDARIALAIFGALSVISGAALYSAIQNAKVTSMITELKEISKAIEVHFLDTNTWFIQQSPSSNYSTGPAHDLRLIMITQNLTGSSWNGPYISGFTEGTHGLSKNGYGYNLALNRTSGSAWGGQTSAKPWEDSTAFCTAGRNCSIWIMVSFESADIPKSIDEYIDGSETPITGKIKWYYNNSNSLYYLFYRAFDLGDIN